MRCFIMIFTWKYTRLSKKILQEKKKKRKIHHEKLTYKGLRSLLLFAWEHWEAKLLENSASGIFTPCRTLMSGSTDKYETYLLYPFF